jgi:hypothetical protein
MRNLRTSTPGHRTQTPFRKAHSSRSAKTAPTTAVCARNL